MTIYISPFWCGVIATIVVEIVGLVAAAMLSGRKKRQ